MGIPIKRIKMAHRLPGITDKGMERLASKIQKSRKDATQDNEVWDKLEHLKGHLGPDQLLEELVQAMSTEEANENFDFIIQMHDIPMDYDDEY
jgi:hypothetical protein